MLSIQDAIHLQLSNIQVCTGTPRPQESHTENAKSESRIELIDGNDTFNNANGEHKVTGAHEAYR